MQTFLVSYNLEENAKCLDNKRLFKQLLEGYQILNTLINNGQWSNHPASKAWRGFESYLYVYIEYIWKECQNRGIAQDSELLFKSIKLLTDAGIKGKLHIKPNWWGREDIIASHRGRLKCKGEIDSICSLIKKKNGIKNIDKWLKERFKKIKNQLKYSDIENLKSWLTEEEKCSIVNHYDKFGWVESPGLEYVWPV